MEATSFSLPQQQELPLAMVKGMPLMAFPNDLYIPPEALEVFLETFEGPLDLLLYLIKKQNLEVVDIPIAKITKQYMQYIETMEKLKFELAAEYLVMAAMLAEIKSRMLLPVLAADDEEDEADPRMELIRRLQEYEQYKQAAEDLNQLPRLERDVFNVHPLVNVKINVTYPDIALADLLSALQSIATREKQYSHHEVEKENFSLAERMAYVLSHLKLLHLQREFITFSDILREEEGKKGKVVSFMAILELSKQALIEIVQNSSYGTIYLKVIA